MQHFSGADLLTFFYAEVKVSVTARKPESGHRLCGQPANGITPAGSRAPSNHAGASPWRWLAEAEAAAALLLGFISGPPLKASSMFRRDSVKEKPGHGC